MALESASAVAIVKGERFSPNPKAKDYAYAYPYS